MALNKPGPIAARAVAEAAANVGVTEVGNNWGRWVKMYLAAVNIFAPAAWCLAFLIFRLRDAAKDLGLKLPKWVPFTGYTPSFVAAAKKQGVWIPMVVAMHSPHATICPGDLVFFFMPDMKRIAHVGIVESVHTWGCMTIEGNTSPEKRGVNRDGGGVWRKERSWGEFGDPNISGFVRLTF